ncbi:MAG: hypothetical protein ABJF11_17510 [Reichenbachiella sp.]|uniref:hypothetical protein n=1 Tax=Reichenbachiella sp. TaxID=2184521 RepID=UPI0032676741
MGIQDFIITPIYFLLFLTLAYFVRPLFTNSQTRPYFIPGLLIKFVGAIALGLIYQYYYGGGDTFTFHTHGSYWIWRAFMDNPVVGIKLLLSDGGLYSGDVYEYTSHIWQNRNEQSYVIIRIAAFFDLFTGATYSATALFFAAFAFSGHWALFKIFQSLRPDKTRQLAIATLFIPSVVFWGSGILKDSITLSALCWMTYLLIQVSVFKKNTIRNSILLIFFAWMIYSIKIYILLCFLIAASLFLYRLFSSIIKNKITRFIVAPFFIIFFCGGGLLVMQQISKDDSRYALDKIGETAKVTAYDIRYGWGARDGENSGYTLGELDGSLGSLLELAPKGIVVTLFRPWLWEVKNPLMLLAALESFLLLLFTLYIVFNLGLKKILATVSTPEILFCISFSMIFAIAVGVSTYNFGSLMRYKIPVMPFYFIGLILSNKKSND